LILKGNRLAFDSFRGPEIAREGWFRGGTFIFSFSASSKDTARSHGRLFPKNGEDREGDFFISKFDLTFGKYPALFASAHLIEEKDPDGPSAGRKNAGTSTPLA